MVSGGSVYSYMHIMLGYKTELGHATCISNECGRRPQLNLFRFMLIVQVPATKAAGSLRLIAHWLRTKTLELASPFHGKQQSTN